MKKLIWLPIVYLIGFGLLLWAIWPRLDNPSAIAVVSVLAGGLAGVVGSAVGGMLGWLRAEKESEDRLKAYASSQALELTKLEFELRRETQAQRQFLAPAKVYREFYKALFQLYSTRDWPKEIVELGLLNILVYQDKDREDSKSRTT